MHRAPPRASPERNDVGLHSLASGVSALREAASDAASHFLHTLKPTFVSSREHLDLRISRTADIKSNVIRISGSWP